MEIVVVLFWVACYFFPTIVASGRSHRCANCIFIVNLFFGWTILGWVISLAWSVGPNVSPSTEKKVDKCLTLKEKRERGLPVV